MLGGRPTKSQFAILEELAESQHFSNLIEHMENEEARWMAFLDNPQAETDVPEPWLALADGASMNEKAKALKKLIIVKALRPDRMVAAVKKFLDSPLAILATLS